MDHHTTHHHRCWSAYCSLRNLLLVPSLLQKEDHLIQRTCIHLLRRHDTRCYCVRARPAHSLRLRRAFGVLRPRSVPTSQVHNTYYCNGDYSDLRDIHESFLKLAAGCPRESSGRGARFPASWTPVLKKLHSNPSSKLRIGCRRET
jgi:hypothetical protein